LSVVEGAAEALCVTDDPADGCAGRIGSGTELAWISRATAGTVASAAVWFFNTRTTSSATMEVAKTAPVWSTRDSSAFIVRVSSRAA
jgi:hypothetical protein